MDEEDLLSPVQLSLGVTLRDDATFANFYAENGNAIIVNVLKAIATGSEKHSHALWGAPGCGLTHLMQALCHAAFKAGRSVQYLPMRDIRGYSAEDVCDGLEGTEIVCIDGLDLICGNRPWEIALFHLFNKLRDAGHTLVMASHTSPPSLPVLLADLKSRILGSIIYHLESLSDVEKQSALIMRAEARGLNMPEDVAKFILNRASRDMNDLFYLLNRLDEVSMQQQRKLTIPFVKDALHI